MPASPPPLAQALAGVAARTEDAGPSGHRRPHQRQAPLPLCQAAGYRRSARASGGRSAPPRPSTAATGASIDPGSRRPGSASSSTR